MTSKQNNEQRAGNPNDRCFYVYNEYQDSNIVEPCNWTRKMHDDHIDVATHPFTEAPQTSALEALREVMTFVPHLPDEVEKRVEAAITSSPAAVEALLRRAIKGAKSFEDSYVRIPLWEAEAALTSSPEAVRSPFAHKGLSRICQIGDWNDPKHKDCAEYACMCDCHQPTEEQQA